MLSEWMVVQNTSNNSRVPPFAVRAKPVGRPAPEGLVVLWSGQAASRQAAWDEATRTHSWLANVPFPSTYQSTDVFARVRPRRERASPKSLPKDPQRRGTMGPVRDGILTIAIRNGARGVTSDELEAEMPGVRPGSIRGEFSYLKSYQWMTRHPSGETRVSRKGHAREVFVLNSEAIPIDERSRLDMLSVDDVLRRLAKPSPRSHVNPKFNGHTKRIRSAILEIARDAGEKGITLSEARVYAEARIPGANRGSIQSRCAELVELGLLILHPTLKRPSVDPPARGRLQRVYVFTPMPVLFTWADHFKDLADQPPFKRILDAINDLRREELEVGET